MKKKTFWKTIILKFLHQRTECELYLLTNITNFFSNMQQKLIVLSTLSMKKMNKNRRVFEQE